MCTIPYRTVAAICPVILIAAHLALGYALSLSPVLPLVGQGIAYSVFAAALWPSIPFTVPREAEGLAYGFVTAVQNGGLALFPIVVSMVYGGAGDRYIPAVELVFVGFAVVGLVTGLCLNAFDVTHGHVLNSVHLDEPKQPDAEEAAGDAAPAVGSTKTQSPLRWAVLFSSCAMLIGNYYCYDNPAALKTQLQHSLGEDDDE